MIYAIGFIGFLGIVLFSAWKIARNKRVSELNQYEDGPLLEEVEIST